MLELEGQESSIPQSYLASNAMLILQKVMMLSSYRESTRKWDLYPQPKMSKTSCDTKGEKGERTLFPQGKKFQNHLCGHLPPPSACTHKNTCKSCAFMLSLYIEKLVNL